MKPNFLILGATGGIGYGLTKALLDQQIPTTILVRQADKALTLFGNHPILTIIVGDATNSETLQAAMQYKTHVFHGLNTDYEKWEDFMPKVTRSVIDAASLYDVTIVFPGNNYNYGPLSEPITEVTPFQPSSPLGKIRVELERSLQQAAKQRRVKVIVVRLPEVWGPNVTNKTFAPVFTNAIKGKKIPWLYEVDVPQQMVYNLDAGQAILAICEQYTECQSYAVYNYPGQLHSSMRYFFQLVSWAAGTPLRISLVPSWLIQLLGLVNPTARALQDLRYKYEQTILLDGKKFNKAFPSFEPTPINEAAEQTIDWYQKYWLPPSQKKKRQGRRKFLIDFTADNLSIGLFPFVISGISYALPGLQSFTVILGVLAGIYWAPVLRGGLHRLLRRNQRIINH